MCCGSARRRTCWRGPRPPPMRGAGTKRHAIYRQAIAASPDSAFLYRDLAAVEQKAGQTAECPRALPQGRRARRQRCAIAGRRLARFSRARATWSARWRPTSVPGRSIRRKCRRASIARLRAAAALAKLPAEYRAIPSSASVTRADIAALVGVQARTAAGARAAAAGDHHRHSRPLGAAVDRAGRAVRRHGHAAELRIRAGAAGPAR